MQRLTTTAWVLAAAGLAAVTGCSEPVNPVPSGTYEGTVTGVEPANREIYVRIEDGRTIELRLKPFTRLVQDTEQIDIQQFIEGSTVRVHVENTGAEHLKPIKIELLSRG